jgi:hypothetical protein
MEKDETIEVKEISLEIRSGSVEFEDTIAAPSDVKKWRFNDQSNGAFRTTNIVVIISDSDEIIVQCVIKSNNARIPNRHPNIFIKCNDNNGQQILEYNAGNILLKCTSDYVRTARRIYAIENIYSEVKTISLRIGGFNYYRC